MISDEGINLLRIAVIKQAVHDYKCALRYRSTREIVKLEQFFLYDLGVWCSLNGQCIIDEIRKQVNNHSGRETI